MALNYDYDESSETWPFFLLTVLLMAVLPLTLLQLRALFSSDSDSNNSSSAEESELSSLSKKYTPPATADFAAKFQHKGTSVLLSLRSLLCLVGWLAIAFLVQRISASGISGSMSGAGAFDPYEILGISSSASDRDIKSAYRKLSLKFHPDKLPKDLTEAAKTAMEEAFVQISKAYEALTDEAVKENYLKYGHPDGPQTTSHGIALPSLLIDSRASLVLVVLYIASFVVILPYFVAQWWNRSKMYTRGGLHVKTAARFASCLVNYKPSQVVTVDMIVHWLSRAEEFRILFPGHEPLYFENLLQDYLHGRDSGSAKENEARLRCVAKCHTLLHGMLEVCCGFRNLEIAIATLDTFKCIVQGVPMSRDAQIMQLPNVDAAAFHEGKVDDICTLGKLFTYDNDKIGKILGIKDADKLKDTLDVAAAIPHLQLLRADFVVPGEEYVTPLSTPYIAIKVLVRSAMHRVIPTDKFPAEMLAEPQDFEHMKNPFASMEKQPVLPTSYAPRFPVPRRNAWMCLLALQKDVRILQTPYKLERLSLANMHNHLDKRTVAKLGPDFDPHQWEVASIRMPLGQQAPQEVGAVHMRVVIKATDYFGADLDLTMTMDVREPPRVDEVRDDIYADDSDDGDDSEADGESDDEDSDEEYTDIDTDTDAED
ncbi:protein-transporting protein [Maudiozyma humilis]|uniref:Protein-transporting protein n=1 Tax=Maudiozyma humilis TaxID=51915 RepID=A0AAV5S041_MAUHU|nr:protein-transporting protein [Kazachstania humilis]